MDVINCFALEKCTVCHEFIIEHDHSEQTALATLCQNIKNPLECLKCFRYFFQKSPGTSHKLNLFRHLHLILVVIWGKVQEPGVDKRKAV